MSKRMPPRYSASAVLMFPIVVCSFLGPVLDFSLRRLILDLKVHLARLATGEERDAFLESLQRKPVTIQPIDAHPPRREQVQRGAQVLRRSRVRRLDRQLAMIQLVQIKLRQRAGRRGEEVDRAT